MSISSSSHKHPEYNLHIGDVVERTRLSWEPEKFGEMGVQYVIRGWVSGNGYTDYPDLGNGIVANPSNLKRVTPNLIRNEHLWT